MIKDSFVDRVNSVLFRIHVFMWPLQKYNDSLLLEKRHLIIWYLYNKYIRGDIKSGHSNLDYSENKKHCRNILYMSIYQFHYIFIYLFLHHCIGCDYGNLSVHRCVYNAVVNSKESRTGVQIRAEDIAFTFAQMLLERYDSISFSLS